MRELFHVTETKNGHVVLEIGKPSEVLTERNGDATTFIAMMPEEVYALATYLKNYSFDLFLRKVGGVYE